MLFFVLRQQAALHVKDDRRVVNLAEQLRVLVVILKNESRAKVLGALQLSAQISGGLPLDDRAGQVVADALDAHQRRAVCLQYLGGVAEDLEQLPHPNRPDPLEQIQNHQCLTRVHGRTLAREDY